MKNPTNTRSSILVFLLIIAFGLFAIIYTFYNENWKITDNIHIRSIMVIIAIWIICLVKLIKLIKEYLITKGENPDEYIILPITFVIALMVMGFYMIVYYPFVITSINTILGILIVILSLLYVIVYWDSTRDESKDNIRFLMILSIGLFVVSIITTFYLLVFYPLVPYTVETDLGSFMGISAIGVGIYFIDFMLESPALDIVKIKQVVKKEYKVDSFT